VHDWTPWISLGGGALIGLAASLLFWSTGRIAGISGIVAGLLLGARGDRAWRAAFLTGLLTAGFVCAAFSPGSIMPSPRSLPVVALAGALVGIGTRLGNGCTSGHGVCGVARLSPRSIAATLTFTATGMLTVACWRWCIAK